MNLKHIRAYLAVCCLVVVLQPLRGLAQQNSDAVKTVPQPVLTERDGQHDFDFELGSWKIHLKRLLHPGPAAAAAHAGRTAARGDQILRRLSRLRRHGRAHRLGHDAFAMLRHELADEEIGRGSCRERV